MTPLSNFFKGKKVTLMGLGLLGRGVGDAAFLARCGAHVHVTDLKTEEQLKDSVSQLKQYPTITFRLGEHVLEDFTSADMIIKAAGVPLHSPYIASAREKGIPVYMTTALFAQFAMEKGARIVGVTGTRGKSTITHMIFHALKQANKRAIVGGNVRGSSTLAKIDEVQEGDIIVLELDSWQLQGFGDLNISPHIAVFSNLMPDHQNYYPDMDAYFVDKAQIFLHQKEGDALFVGESLIERVRALHPNVEPHVPPPLPKEWNIAIPGAHNRLNAAFAADVLRTLALSEEEIQAGIESFQGVEGRLQLVREIRGVKIYNDNNATTPEATIAALKALHTEKNIILIMGGSDKGLDMSTLLYEIAGTCKRVILLAGSGTDRITPFMQDFSVFDSLDSAVKEALQSATEGDVILFSPAFASFGMFTNEYERNDQFLSIVESL